MSWAGHLEDGGLPAVLRIASAVAAGHAVVMTPLSPAALVTVAAIPAVMVTTVSVVPAAVTAIVVAALITTMAVILRTGSGRNAEAGDHQAGSSEHASDFHLQVLTR